MGWFFHRHFDPKRSLFTIWIVGNDDGCSVEIYDCFLHGLFPLLTFPFKQPSL